MDPDLLWQEVNFNQSTFWVQLHGLPSLWQKAHYLHVIAKEIGTVVENVFEGVDEIPWRKYNSKDCLLPPVALSNQFGIRFTAYGTWLSAENDAAPPRIYERKVVALEEHDELNRISTNSGGAPSASPPSLTVMTELADLDKTTRCHLLAGIDVLGSSDSARHNTDQAVSGLSVAFASRVDTSLIIPAARIVDGVCRAHSPKLTKLTRKEILKVRPSTPYQLPFLFNWPIYKASSFGLDNDVFDPNISPLSITHNTSNLSNPARESDDTLVNIPIAQACDIQAHQKPIPPIHNKLSPLSLSPIPTPDPSLSTIPTPDPSLTSHKRKSPPLLPVEKPKKAKNLVKPKLPYLL
ncbi:hypothetical protein FCV25MIE_18555 [Fagus crenata]